MSVRALVATGLVAIAGCAASGPPSAPRPAPRADVPAPPPASAAATEQAAPLPPRASEPAAPKPALEPRSIGDVTCESDVECAVTTRADCCDCCVGPPMATSSAWLAWRDQQLCASTRCEPCGKVKCPDVASASDVRAVCRERACVLERIAQRADAG